MEAARRTGVWGLGQGLGRMVESEGWVRALGWRVGPESWVGGLGRKVGWDVRELAGSGAEWTLWQHGELRHKNM